MKNLGTECKCAQGAIGKSHLSGGEYVLIVGMRGNSKMSLITMGYGHLTIITMGLGNSFRIIQQERPYQVGVVEFQDVTPKVAITDQLIKASFEDKEKETYFEDEEIREVIENA